MPEFSNAFSGLANDRRLTSSELVRAIRFMIAAEYEAVQLYQQLAESTDNELAKVVLIDIADEEKVHAGEFLKLLHELQPDEEGFYKETQRALDSHAEFVKESLSGTAPHSKPKSKKGKTTKTVSESSQEDGIDYIIVRFLRPIKEPFMGLDEKTHGPFEKEDVAKIPAANVRIWLRDGTATRIVPEDGVILDE